MVRCWKINYRLLQQKGILIANDYEEMMKTIGSWATHLALAQADPNSITRTQLIERAKQLRLSVDPFLMAKIKE